jgi:hypothetical protein
LPSRVHKNIGTVTLAELEISAHANKTKNIRMRWKMQISARISVCTFYKESKVVRGMEKWQRAQVKNKNIKPHVDNSLHSFGPDLPLGDLITTSWVEFTEPATTSTAAYATEKLPAN